MASSSLPSFLLTGRYSSLLLALLFSQWTLATSGSHVYTDSFPRNDEYDFQILDPNHVFGSPYGGFSRATRSRLASLPLPLPSAKLDDFPNNNPIYVQVRDGDGRLFACRLYHQEEIAATSLTDSMFDAVTLLKGSNNNDNNNNNNDDRNDSSKHQIQMQEQSHPIPIDNIVDSLTVDKDIPSSKGPVPKVSKESLKENTGTTNLPEQIQNGKTSVQEITSNMNKLAGICTQIHTGWWSYEWCYGDKITQFHIVFDDTTKPGHGNVRIDDVTNLGKFSESKMVLADSQVATKEKDTVSHSTTTTTTDNEKSAENLGYRKVFAKGETEIGTMTENFNHGDICPATNSPRTVSVIYRCCSIKAMDAFKSGILYKGKPIASTIAAAINIEEPSVCSYQITICTPLLCHGLADQYEQGVHTPEMGKKPLKQPSPVRRPRKEHESIRETLDRTLEHVCLQKVGSDWWSYEICHGTNIRQFHENHLLDSTTGTTSKAVEAENILGLYDSEGLESFPTDHEIDFVVNATDDLGDDDFRLVATKSKAIPTRGNGAYFKQEYIGGDVCVTKDITDVAIKAGTVAEGSMKRATTVRFFCGNRVELTQVNEDSTCHYIIDVIIPDLCFHPLFKAPVVKQQVMKCLPVKEK